MYDEKYLFRISLKPSDVWSKYYSKTIKPVYFVAATKEETTKWAEENLESGLSIRSISMIARQLAPRVYTGEIKPR